MSTYETPYQALGAEGIQAITNEFYDIMDSDEQFTKLRAMHAEDLNPMKIKLAEYLTGWMGGPPVYAEKYGGVCMTEPHANYWIGPDERDEWLACMNLALDKVVKEESVRDMLRAPLFQLADAVKNRETAKTVDPNIIASH
mgnify:CR=1 FL=1